VTSSSSFAKKALASVGGQAYARAAQFLNNVILVPLLLQSWGIAGYGQWLATTALAFYVTLTNFGFPNAAMSEMLQAAGGDDLQKTRECFQKTLTMLLASAIPVLTIIAALCYLLPISRVFQLDAVSPQSLTFVLVFLSVQIWVDSIKSIFMSASFASGRYGAPNLISGTAKLVEIAGISSILLFFHGSQVQVAIILCGVSILDLICNAGFACRYVPWVKLQLKMIDATWLRGLLRPSAGVMMVNLVHNGLLIQAPRILLNATIGSAAVATYGVYSAAIRATDQITSLFAELFYLEFARNSGAKLRPRILGLLAMSTHFGVAAFASISVLLLVFGPVIFECWSRGQIQFSYSLLIPFLVMAGTAQLGRAYQQYLQGANMLFFPSFLSLCGAILGVGVGALAAPMWGILGMVAGVAMGEALKTTVNIIGAARALRVPVIRLGQEMIWVFRRGAGVKSA
jgi:O-antigen/teichoic acid export membrane protein